MRCLVRSAVSRVPALRASASGARRGLASLAPVPASDRTDAGGRIEVHDAFELWGTLPDPPTMRSHALAEHRYGKFVPLRPRVLADGSHRVGKPNQTLIGLADNHIWPSSREEGKYNFGHKFPLPGRPLVPRHVRRLERKKMMKADKAAKKEAQLSTRLGLKTRIATPYVRTDGAFKTFKPVTPGIRHTRLLYNPYLFRGEPEYGLTVPLRKSGGRSENGRIATRGIGGGHKQRIRLVDFARWESGLQDVLTIEYDPGRSSHVALIENRETKVRSYIVAADGLRAGDTVRSYRTDGVSSFRNPEMDNKRFTEEEIAKAPLDLGMFRMQALRPGNCLPLSLIPIGTEIHNITLAAKGKGKLMRSAGSSAQLVGFMHRQTGARPGPLMGELTEKGTPIPRPELLPGNAEENALLSREGQLEKLLGGKEAAAAMADKPTATHAVVKMQSGEVRMVPVNGAATIGRVSNTNWQHRKLGKAGRARWLGRRPKVRGVAMNHCDHPNGGGRGKTKGNHQSKDKWGNLARGGRTRRPTDRGGNIMVLRQRPRKGGHRGKPKYLNG